MRALLALALLLVPSAAFAVSAEALPQLTLKGGEGTSIPDTGLVVLLTDVTDQRRPPEVDCYWEGMIRANLVILGPRPELYEIVLCNLCDDAERSATVAGLELTLIGLSPSREELAKLGRDSLLTDYSLTITYGPANR